MADALSTLQSALIGHRLDGRPIYLCQGGSSVEPPPVVLPGALPVDPPKDGDDKPLGENGEKALRAERTRASAAEKRANELEARLKEHEDKGKTEEQRRQDADALLVSERDTATVKALRYEVCAEKDLPLAAARFLTGGTKAEIEEAADAFKALGVASKPATGLPASPNAGRQTQTPSGAEAGLAEARRRYPELAK